MVWARLVGLHARMRHTELLRTTPEVHRRAFRYEGPPVLWGFPSGSLRTNAKITPLPGEAKSLVDRRLPLACNPPEPDFLVRSRIPPQEVMKTAEEFIALRKHCPVVCYATCDRWPRHAHSLAHGLLAQQPLRRRRM